MTPHLFLPLTALTQARSRDLLMYSDDGPSAQLSRSKGFDNPVLQLYVHCGAQVAPDTAFP